MNVLELNLALDDAGSEPSPWREATLRDLPRRRARRRQDVRDARTRAAGADRGTDVVVGFVETHGRAADRGADRRPRGRARGERSSTAAATLEEMDVDAVLARRPAGRAGRRARAHERARLAQREALAGRRGAARRRASTSSRRSTSSTSSRSTTSSSGSPASSSARRSPTRSSGAPTRSSSST